MTETERRLNERSEIHRWTTKYTDRIQLSLLYLAGELSVEDAVRIGEHKDADTFLQFTETQKNYAKRLVLKGRS